MVIIPPSIFDLLFYVIVFVFGLDFSISGFLVLREGHANLEKPRLVGLWIIRRMSALPSVRNRSNLFALLYSTRSQAIQGLVGGVLLIFASLVMIVEIGMGLF